MKTLRAQIAAFKRLSSGLPLPPALARVVRDPNVPIPDLNKILATGDPAARVVDAAVKLIKDQDDDTTAELRIEDAEGIELVGVDGEDGDGEDGDDERREVARDVRRNWVAVHIG